MNALLTFVFPYGNRFVPAMKFGALSDMVGIKEKTLKKLSKQQVKSFQLYYTLLSFCSVFFYFTY